MKRNSIFFFGLQTNSSEDHFDISKIDSVFNFDK